MPDENFKKILRKINKSPFKNRAVFDSMRKPDTIIGRTEKIEEILRNLIGYKENYATPLLSICGRSGSGKTATVRYILENMDDIDYSFVNLKRCNTVFGAANLILESLGESPISNQLGMKKAVKKIQDAKHNGGSCKIME